MSVTLRVGRSFLGIAMLGFGIEYFILDRFVSGLAPVPPWTPGGRIAAYVTGTLLVAAGACIAAGWQVRRAAGALAFLFVLSALVLHSQRFSGILHSGNIRTGAFEALALGAAALVLAAGAATEGHRATTGWALWLGNFLFGFSMVIFGIQHFMYAAYIATLVTPWIPGHLFFVYFTGCAFIASGVLIITGVKGSLGALGMGVMFLLWVLVLHGPRVAAALHNQGEWASLLVALGISGGGFVIAATLRNQD
jgi:uncharacterized membrane protein